MTSSNVKSTWELAGRLSSSFSESTKRAQTQLATLRREYRTNAGELRRMQSVMRTAAQGTDAYANAQRRIPQLQDDLTKQAFAIGDLEKEALGGARAQERLSGASGRAGAGLKSLATFGLAAGGAIGIAAGAVAFLTKELNAAGREAQSLQALSTRGVDTQAYQQASSQLHILTGDAKSARQAVETIVGSGNRVRSALDFDPSGLSNIDHRAIEALGFDSARAFEMATKNVAGFVDHVRDLWQEASQGQKAYIRGAVDVSQIVPPSLISSIEEENRLLQRRNELEGQRGQGTLAPGDVREMERIDAKLARIHAGFGIMTKEQMEAAERWSETSQLMSQATKDLKVAVASSFADDFAAAAKELTKGILLASDLWDKIRPEEDNRPPEQRVPSGRDWADLLLTGGSGLLNDGDSRPLGDYTREIGRFAKYQVDSAKALGDDIDRIVDALNTFTLPGFANGGVVPGPTGRPRLAVVHGGEEVMTASDRRGNGAGVVQQTNYFQIDGATSPMATAEEVVNTLRRELARGVAW